MNTRGEVKSNTRQALLCCVLLLCFVLPATGPAWSQRPLEIIALRHRSVEQVLPALRPLLERDGVLSGQGYQLFVRTSPANLAEIKAALAAIDTQARRLVISVRFGQAGEDTRSRIGAGATIGNDGVRIRAQAGETRGQSSERIDQTLQVLEGARAFIATGESRPLAQREVVRTPGGVLVRETTTVQNISTGFEIVPRLGAGEQVQLDVMPQRESAGATPGSVQGQRVATTLRARLGEWIEIGGTTEQRSFDRRGPASSDTGVLNESRGVWLKVDEAR